jgi:deoxyribonuclease V
MDTFKLKREQLKLAPKIKLQDSFSKVTLIAGIESIHFQNRIMASVVVCKFPSMEVIEKKTYVLDDPLPYRPGFQAYREMPAMIEAINLLDNDPDVLIILGNGIAHPRKIGLASHLGLSLNKPTIGVIEKLQYGKIVNGKIINNNEFVGFEVKTREHAKPIYISPGHQITLGSTINIIKESIRFPHKMPEPIHLAHKIGIKKTKKK